MSVPTTSTSSSSLAGPSGPSPHPMLENNEEKNSVVIKVGMVGDSQIGKTSLMVKYVEGSFDEDYIQTLGWYSNSITSFIAQPDLDRR